MTQPLSLNDIAERLQGYDPQALAARHVNDFLAQLVQPVGEQDTVALMQAHGRILAQDVVSPIRHRLGRGGLERPGTSR